MKTEQIHQSILECAITEFDIHGIHPLFIGVEPSFNKQLKDNVWTISAKINGYIYSTTPFFVGSGVGIEQSVKATVKAIVDEIKVTNNKN